MNYFQNKKNVEEYLSYFADSEESKYMISHLRNFLKNNSSLLELGMGSGADLNILNNYYKVTGSDYSIHFLDFYKAKFPNSNINLIQIDALTLNINEKYDCIYSNKVFHQFSQKEFETSLQKQYDILNQNGLICHSLWQDKNNTKEIIKEGLSFQKYNLQTISKIVEKYNFTIKYLAIYKEIEENDSLLVIAQKN